MDSNDPSKFETSEVPAHNEKPIITKEIILNSVVCKIRTYQSGVGLEISNINRLHQINKIFIEDIYIAKLILFSLHLLIENLVETNSLDILIKKLDGRDDSKLLNSDIVNWLMDSLHEVMSIDDDLRTGAYLQITLIEKLKNIFQIIWICSDKEVRTTGAYWINGSDKVVEVMRQIGNTFPETQKLKLNRN